MLNCSLELIPQPLWTSFFTLLFSGCKEKYVNTSLEIPLTETALRSQQVLTCSRLYPNTGLRPCHWVRNNRLTLDSSFYILLLKQQLALSRYTTLNSSASNKKQSLSHLSFLVLKVTLSPGFFNQKPILAF